MRTFRPFSAFSGLTIKELSYAPSRPVLCACPRIDCLCRRRGLGCPSCRNDHRSKSNEGGIYVGLYATPSKFLNGAQVDIMKKVRGQHCPDYGRVRQPAARYVCGRCLSRRKQQRSPRHEFSGPTDRRLRAVERRPRDHVETDLPAGRVHGRRCRRGGLAADPVLSSARVGGARPEKAPLSPDGPASVSTPESCARIVTDFPVTEAQRPSYPPVLWSTFGLAGPPGAARHARNARLEMERPNAPGCVPIRDSRRELRSPSGPWRFQRFAGRAAQSPRRPSRDRGR